MVFYSDPPVSALGSPQHSFGQRTASFLTGNIGERLGHFLRQWNKCCGSSEGSRRHKACF
jgi:hypothetical protein